MPPAISTSPIRRTTASASSTRDGIINTFAGTGGTSFGGGPRTFNDGGPATQALLHLPSGVAVDKSGNVFIADTGDNMIRKVTTDGIINLFAGDSYPGYFDKPGRHRHRFRIQQARRRRGR